MIRYEIKKIFSKSMSKAAFAVLFFTLVLSCYFAITSVTYIDENGVSHTGISAAQSLRAEKQKWEGLVTEELLQAVIEENKYVNENYPYNPYENRIENEIYASKTQGFSDLKDMINQGSCEFREYTPYRIDSVTTDEVYNVYENRYESLNKWLNSEEAKDEFSEKERAFLLNQYSKMDIPLYYEDCDGWKFALGWSQTIIMVVMLVGAFLVAGIFSNEFSWRADSIFFSTKYGRDKGTRSKIAAGLIVITVIYWSMVVLYSCIVLGVLGFGGSQCKIQMGFGHWKSFYNLTYLQLYLLTIVAGYLGTLFCLLLSMIISAKTHTSIVAVTVPFVILFLPLFLSNVRFMQDILGLFPDQLLQINEIINLFRLYHVGGRVVGSIPIMMVIYPLFCIILLPILYRVYHKTEIK